MLLIIVSVIAVLRSIESRNEWREYLNEESLDEDKFIKHFTSATVKGWKGLKLEYLEDLLLVDLAKQDTKLPLTYTDENAQTLVENSSEFDNWLNEVVFDLDNFRSQSEKEDKGEPDRNTEPSQISTYLASLFDKPASKGIDIDEAVGYGFEMLIGIFKYLAIIIILN